MKYKLLRALCYLKELLVMLLCKLLGAVCRAFSPAYRGIWLVGERGTDARDNGYWFYRYLRTQHPELRTYYVITADSPDAARSPLWVVRCSGAASGIICCTTAPTIWWAPMCSPVRRT